MPGLISQKVSMMYQTKSKEIEHVFYMPFWFIWLNGGQDHTQEMLALLLKSPSAEAKKSIEDAGFKLFREMEVYQAVQLLSLLQLPMNMYKRMQRLLSNLGYSYKFLPSHHCILTEQKKLVPHITKATFATVKIYINSMGEKSQFITVIL